MCDPVTAAVVLAVAASAAQSVGQQQAADYENHYQKMVYGETVKQANSAALEQYASLRQREAQESEAAANGIQKLTSEARMARSAATLQAAETGTTGGSVESLLRDFQRNELVSRGVAVSNLEATRLQIRADERQVAAQRQQRILEALPKPVMGPFDSPMGIVNAGLSAASAGFGAYGAASSAQAAGATSGTPGGTSTGSYIQHGP